MLKNFEFAGRWHLQFHADFENLFNHPNYGLRDLNVGDPSMGEVTSAIDLRSRVQRTYEKGDEARIRAILEEYENSRGSVIRDDVASQLVRTIRRISRPA